MKLYLTDNRHWTGTQVDAKAAGSDVQNIEVPTDKPGLLAFLNEEWDAFYAEIDRLKGAAPADAADEDRPEVAAPPVSADQPMGTRPSAPFSGDLSEHIGKLEGAALFNVVQAVLGRMHEIGGSEGWPAFAKHNNAFGRGYKVATERALGMLLLAGLEPVEKPVDKSRPLI